MLHEANGVILIKSTHPGLQIRLLQVNDAERLLEIRRENFDFFKPFEPERPEIYFTLEEQARLISNGLEAAQAGQGYTFGLFLLENNKLIGRMELSGVARGPFQNANLGYFVDPAYHGQGYATSAVKDIVRYALNELELHRIQAGVMPRNTPSNRVMEKAGFRREGLALNYLKINGVWEDHVLYAVTAEDLQNGVF
ncbi:MULTISPECIES: GNAT family N-acetyltransferase [Paenibacillus]|uniref:Ribosomal-protein-alanine N-acetyltransferase n=1 Tax=Paenibacillus peoriae TaxID=59893 RepID=A0ABU1QMF6_9BACL|nr:MULTISPECIES: GNAT family N-acetyltransferase [Paenibacillus]AHC18170.1 alanine acetyltransferase [Paenibacillus polymyxa CR1]APQ57760.1 alanine acetyltransferase [Paenibacillus polymyxa]MCP3746467.1 GNAT family N-acetyltransferase [Paenibacillus sp. A3M_27_13]MDR6780334.1 ribosomal-protein-alanine N-acetyltransferase [Paenibacillus peoriae]VUG06984.1 Putative ribosomal N-acetyltransferase YdaF [Paenibacillus polymyxa]